MPSRAGNDQRYIDGRALGRHRRPLAVDAATRQPGLRFNEDSISNVGPWQRWPCYNVFIVGAIAKW